MFPANLIHNRPLYVVIFILASTLFGLAQGNLTPSGAPAPTMKTLQQVEPRSPISSLPFTITNGGSYYLTSNLTALAGQDGITIQADNVTVDLAGFALAGGGNNGCIVSGSRQSIAILNGTVRGWAVAGVNAATARQVRCVGLLVSSNGTDGLNAGSDSLVESCIAIGNGGVGVSVQNSSQVIGCVSDANGTGFRTVGSGNRLENNQAGTNSVAGFKLEGAQNLLIRNFARQNGTNFNIALQNAYGQILLNPFGVITNSNPWLNFEFFCGAEICNGLDDDCNGVVDNGNPGGGGVCSSGLPGICSPGILVCTNGAVSCLPNVQPTAETCNGADDDCNGVVDNGNPGGGSGCNTGQLGICVAGTVTCTNGALSCVRNNNPSSEVCDGLDNNCDGSVDNGATCAAGQSCLSGACKKNQGVVCSAGSECGSGFCVDGVCCGSSCANLCQACTLAKKGSGVDGVCGNIASNTDPDNECSGGAGFCNGAGACF